MDNPGLNTMTRTETLSNFVVELQIEDLPIEVIEASKKYLLYSPQRSSYSALPSFPFLFPNYASNDLRSFPEEGSFI